MYINNDTLVKEFYKTLPTSITNHISLEEVDRVCKSPFHFARYHMRRSQLNSIRLKYFGTFFLYPNKILRLLENNDYNLKHEAITPKTHQEAKEHLLKVYSDVVSVRETSKWGRGINVIDTTEELPQNEL